MPTITYCHIRKCILTITLCGSSKTSVKTNRPEAAGCWRHQHGSKQNQSSQSVRFHCWLRGTEATASLLRSKSTARFRRSPGIFFSTQSTLIIDLHQGGAAWNRKSNTLNIHYDLTPKGVTKCLSTGTRCASRWLGGHWWRLTDSLNGIKCRVVVMWPNRARASRLFTAICMLYFFVPWPHSILVVFFLTGHWTASFLVQSVFFCLLVCSDEQRFKGSRCSNKWLLLLICTHTHTEHHCSDDWPKHDLVAKRPEILLAVFAEPTLSELNGKVASAELPHR